MTIDPEDAKRFQYASFEDLIEYINKLESYVGTLVHVGSMAVGGAFTDSEESDLYRQAIYAYREFDWWVDEQDEELLS